MELDSLVQIDSCEELMYWEDRWINGYAFLEDSYLEYEWQMTQTDERYLLKPRIEYVMRNTDSSVLDSGTLYLDSENYSQNTLLETWIDSLNTQYQSVKGLTSSDTESIGWTISQGDWI